MNALSTTWRQLVRRKLWPLAVLLVAALAAVPVLLARDAAAPVLPQDPVPMGAATAGDEIAEPIVAMAEAGDRDRRRRVLGSRKDPFAPAPLVKKKQAKQPAQQADADETGGSDVPDTSTGTGSAPAPDQSSPSPSLPVPAPEVEPEPKKRTYPADSLIVRFGDATADTREKQVLRKLAPLPQESDEAEAEPLLVYLGLTKDNKKAIFLVDASLEATGDGSCKPHPSSCETIHLSKGETEFFDVFDPETGEVTAQYQLDLVDIKSRDSKSARKAHVARSAQVAAGL
jgi:hypothetical protein